MKLQREEVILRDKTSSDGAMEVTGSLTGSAVHAGMAPACGGPAALHHGAATPHTSHVVAMRSGPV